MNPNTALSVLSFILLGLVFALAVYLLKWWKIEATDMNKWPGFKLFALAILLLMIGILVGAHARVYPYVSAYTWDILGMSYSRMDPIQYPVKGTDFTFDPTTRNLKVLATPESLRWGIKWPGEHGKFQVERDFVIPAGVDVDKVEVYFQHIDGRTSSSVQINS